MTRNGKIARLPRSVRDQLNRRLQDGVQGKDIVVWLNGLPETIQLLATEFGGRAISEQNLSEWKAGGFREWQNQQEALALARDLAGDAEELTTAAKGSMADRMATVVTARYAAALVEWDGNPEGQGGRKLRVLRAICQDVVELRRGDHSAARLKMEQEQLDANREKTEEEVVAHFKEWAKNPKMRDVICGKCLTEEEKAERMRELFGIPPENRASKEPKSDPIKPNQTGSNQ